MNGEGHQSASGHGCRLDGGTPSAGVPRGGHLHSGRGVVPTKTYLQSKHNILTYGERF